jgi:methylamine---glutamate N-methyltransferase subunit A
MCGIVGLFLKDTKLEPQLGALLTDMLITMTDRGPDSAGISIYRPSEQGQGKLTLQSADPETDFDGLTMLLGSDVQGAIKDSHMVLTLPLGSISSARQTLAATRPGITVMSAGEGIEIYKEVGLPRAVAARFDLAAMGGTHGIGHTRMATESAVTTQGAHPFSTGADQCLVHNGSLSNHNAVRRVLQRAGMTFQTENDTEVAAAFLTHRMDQGDSLDAAMQATLTDLDGFFTFVVGTKTGFGVVRDPIACKPAVMAETDSYVAFGSEYRAMVGLPGIEIAHVWEPEPATVYFWER